MSKLVISVTTDFSETVLNNVKLIEFTNPDGSVASAIFAAQQLGPGQGPIQADVAIDGSDGINRIVATGNSISVTRWTFSDWGREDVVTIKGTASFDEAEGTIKADRIFGFNGSDFLFGMAGDDTISGGSDGDRISGGPGDDVVLGGGGNDDMQGDEGHNILMGGGGDDLITSITTKGDSINGGGGLDHLDFYAGQDGDIVIDIRDGGGGRGIGGGTTISSIEQLNFSGFSGGGNDRVMGGSLDDFALGGSGDDRIWGFGGDDRLIGGEGDDVLHGGAGNDLFQSWNGEGIDRIEGGTGTDTAGIYNDSFSGQMIDISDGGGGRDIGTGTTLRDIEILVFRGGKGDDTVTGGSGDDSLGGGSGNDELTGGHGEDIFYFDKKSIGVANGVITDFTQGGDSIDMSVIDATPGLPGNSFTFIRDKAFSMTAGELRYVHDGTDTIVEADLTGDGEADFVFTLSSLIDLAAGDFVL